ncbi:NLI interacting factor-like phosphatase-domain-containing protein [Mycena belliarum]|uniref:NLI interacting factor-like phosphatase-domain-containing protein n=1 Tax=Mycena belliarum TaxID=1033014 RepID=A0AAD6U8S5_9AGAR|nr:NLI interacting factor-like phosphatase-domain-containing protein [Mycena belliae]
MNSLTYISRQFDALASARTPPSTPTTEHDSFITDKVPRSRRATGSESSSLSRVKTWSTKSFLLPSRPSGSASAPNARPKRSLSSPADFIAIATMQRPQPPSLASGASVALETSPVVARLESILHRTFVVRVLMLAWNTIRAAWTSLTGRSGLGRSREAAVEDGSPAIEKDSSDDETSDEQSTSPSRLPSSSNRPLYMSMDRSAPDASKPEDSPRGSSLPPDSLLSPPSTLPHGADASTFRSSTPTVSTTRRTPFHLPKTLVLDLDETLIHSTTRPLQSGHSSTGFLGLGTFNRNKGSGLMVEVVLGGQSTLYHVYKRPYVDFFLRTVSGWYTLVVFTASMQEYADPVIDWLDAGRGILAHRLFRDSCTQLPNGSYTKDLSVVDADLSRVCLIDNSPISYRINEANGIPIEGWTHDPSDEALLDLLPILDSLRFTSDVRRVLGLRSAGGMS